jgi:hypothetical protein
MQDVTQAAKFRAHYEATPSTFYPVQVDAVSEESLSRNQPEYAYRASWRSAPEDILADDFEQVSVTRKQLVPGVYRFRVLNPVNGTVLCEYHMRVEAAS